MLPSSGGRCSAARVVGGLGAGPKGPTLDADVRRMAIHVEDHPRSVTSGRTNDELRDAPTLYDPADI